MTLKKTLSLLLALALVLSVMAPCGVLQASAATMYNNNTLEQVTEPVVGESYYLAADVAGTMYYFRHGTVTDTAPYSLVTTNNINHNWAFRLTVESSTETNEKFEGGFQLCYTNPSSGAMSRIYCYDVLKDATTAGQTGIMDTGASSGTAYKNRHSFYMDTVNGTAVLRKYGNDNVLAVKYNDTKGEWRMLGVPEAELANEGVYPAMLLAAHTHAFGETYQNDASKHWKVCACGEKQEEAAHTFGVWAYDAGTETTSRACAVCGYKETATEDVDAPVVGKSYYLFADVEGTPYFFTTGSVTGTAPYSLVTTTAKAKAKMVTPESSVETGEKFEGGFQLTFDNNGTLTRIYCMDALTTGDNKGVMDTGMNTAAPMQNRHSFYEDEVNGVKVLRKYGNENILVVKQLTVNDQPAWRMLGVPEAELANEGVYVVMLKTDVHIHEFSETYQQDASKHWKECECGEKLEEADHSFGEWIYDAEEDTQSRTCSVCGYVDTASGNIEDPVIGKTYYLSADVDGTTYYFRHGTVTDTVPYSLVTTDNINHNWTAAVTLESSTETSEKLEGCFQICYTNPSNDTLTRIYCFDALTTGDNKGVMDTGVNTAAPLQNRHSFFVDTVNGVKVLRKYGNDNILVVKQVPQTVSGNTVMAWRMLGVPEEELANEGVYPVVLQNMKEDSENFADADGNTYTTLQAAVDAVAGKENKVIKLNGDVTGDFTVSGDVILDLGGKTLTGNITLTNGAKLYGMDSSSDGYGQPAGKICGDILDGSAEKVFRNENTKKRYVAVQVTEGEEAFWTFNRFYIGMNSINADVNTGEVGYKAIVGGNENVKSALAENAFGFKVWVEDYEEMKQELSLTKDDFKTGNSGTTLNLRIRNQLSAINQLYISGKTDEAAALQNKAVVAQVTIHFADGTSVDSLPYEFSIVEMYQAVDNGFSAFSDAQKSSITGLVEQFPVMETWNLTNIMAQVNAN